jgi:flagellar biosynthesis protein FlhB
MTRRQWLDDMKRAEGDPAIRRRRRELGRQITRRGPTEK